MPPPAVEMEFPTTFLAIHFEHVHNLLVEDLYTLIFVCPLVQIDSEAFISRIITGLRQSTVKLACR